MMMNVLLLLLLLNDKLLLLLLKQDWPCPSVDATRHTPLGRRAPSI